MRKHPGKALTNMVLSCVLCSIAVNWVALPNGFVVTGITGLSMAAAQFTGVNYALIYYGLALAILLCTALALAGGRSPTFWYSPCSTRWCSGG